MLWVQDLGLDVGWSGSGTCWLFVGKLPVCLFLCDFCVSSVPLLHQAFVPAHLQLSPPPPPVSCFHHHSCSHSACQLQSVFIQVSVRPQLSIDVRSCAMSGFLRVLIGSFCPFVFLPHQPFSFLSWCLNLKIGFCEFLLFILFYFLLCPGSSPSTSWLVVHMQRLFFKRLISICSVFIRYFAKRQTPDHPPSSFVSRW